MRVRFGVLVQKVEKVVGLANAQRRAYHPLRAKGLFQFIEQLR